MYTQALDFGGEERQFLIVISYAFTNKLISTKSLLLSIEDLWLLLLFHEDPQSMLLHTRPSMKYQSDHTAHIIYLAGERKGLPSLWKHSLKVLIELKHFKWF